MNNNFSLYHIKSSLSCLIEEGQTWGLGGGGAGYRVLSWERPRHKQQLIGKDLKKMEEWPAWPFNQWLLRSLLKRGIQASASEENQSMARPLSSALLPALKEKASSQGSDKSRLRIWAIRHDSGLTRGPARRPLVSTVGLSVPRLQGFKLKLPFKSHCTTSTEFTADLT